MSSAENRAREDIQRHPNYAGSYVALARVLLNEARTGEAIPVLVQATERAPDNLLAHELLADCLMKEGEAVEALRIHKIILFLNPQSEKSKRAVQRLESASATSYSEEIFSTSETGSSSPNFAREGSTRDSSLRAEEARESHSLELERSISLFDALVFRNELTKAQKLLGDMESNFGDDPEVQSRKKLFDFEALEEAPLLRPDLSREKMVLKSKIQYLERVLAKLESRKQVQHL